MVHHILSLRFDTSRPKIDRVLQDVEAVVIGDPATQQGTSRVNLVGLRGASYQIELFAYILAPDLNSFTLRQQQLLLNILTAVSQAGACLVFPSSTTYLEMVKRQPENENIRTRDGLGL